MGLKCMETYSRRLGTFVRRAEEAAGGGDEDGLLEAGESAAERYGYYFRGLCFKSWSPSHFRSCRGTYQATMKLAI